jgi:hypothetical protein
MKSLTKKINDKWFARTTALRRIGPTLIGNPKRVGSPGARCIDECYPPPGAQTTLAELLVRGNDRGFSDTDQIGHIAWDIDHGFIEIEEER